MKIMVPFADKVIPDKYAKKSDVMVQGNAVISPPFELSDLPVGTKSLAWTMVDYDSIPVCGFAYIHWVVANVPAAMTVISEDFSRQNQQHTRGKNSLVSKLLPTDYSDIDDGYMGPYPPDKDHIYTLTVYALDSELSLKDGFYLNELQKAVKPHLLETVTIELIGKF